MKKLLSIIAFCFSVCVFADGEGTCTLVQNADGSFRIVCEGDGLETIQQTIVTTQQVCMTVQNCLEVKTDLTKYLDKLTFGESYLDRDFYTLEDVLVASQDLQYFISNARDLNTDPSVDDELNNASLVLTDLDQIVPSVINTAYELNDIIDNIECCSNTNSSGGCSSSSSCCDFSPILQRLDNLVGYYNYITNKFDSVYEKLGGSSHLGYKYIDSDYNLNPNAGLRYFNWNSSKTPYINLLNLALHSQYNNAFGLASANNYLHKLTFLETPYISTNLETLVNESTNFFSFFRGEVGVHGALEDWQPEFGSYYNYLTNHYLKSIIDPSSLSTSEQSKTNWFSRIETLLAAFVFADSDTATNTVDLSYGRDQISELTSGLQSIDQTSYDQLNLFHQTSESLISRVRSFSSAFSNASMPSTVRLVKLGNSDSSYIQFESTEISPLVEACHCATTLAWCLGGLILLFWFIHYTVKASYNLVVFIYSVISSIFSK